MIKYYSGQYTGQKSLFQDKEYYRFAITSSDVDRSGDIVDIDGLDLSEYEQNPIVLYNHHSTPIGISRLTKATNVIYGDVWFDEVDELSKTIKGKVDAGVITNASIGFEVLDYEDRKLTDAEKEKYKRKFQRIRTYTKSILLEWSVVDLPANINAKLQKFINDLGDIMETKIGSTLSKKNRDLLISALNNIKAVINEPDDDDDDEDKVSKSMPNDLETLKNDLRSEFERVTNEIQRGMSEINAKLNPKEPDKKRFKLAEIYN